MLLIVISLFDIIIIVINLNDSAVLGNLIAALFLVKRLLLLD